MTILQEQNQQQLGLAYAYNSRLAGSVSQDPFSHQDKADDAYNHLLNVDGNGMMGHLAIPRIGLDVPIYHGTGRATLQAGIGHLQGTALPVGGTGTHCVLTGHTGLDTARMFTDLDELDKEDVFYLYILDQVLAYQVDSISVVQPHETDLLQPVSGQEYVTLVTCTPYGINSHRLLLRGRRVPYTPGQLEPPGTATPLGKETLLLLAAAATLVALCLVLALVLGANRRKKIRARQKALMRASAKYLYTSQTQAGPSPNEQRERCKQKESPPKLPRD